MEHLGFFKNTLPEQIFIIVCGLAVICAIYQVWKLHYESRKCSTCGTPLVGHLSSAGFLLDGKCESCSGWRTISHAEYNRFFGIKPPIRRIK